MSSQVTGASGAAVVRRQCHHNATMRTSPERCRAHVHKLVYAQLQPSGQSVPEAGSMTFLPRYSLAFSSLPSTSTTLWSGSVDTTGLTIPYVHPSG